MARYKYTSAQAWFREWITTLENEGNLAMLRHIAEQLAMHTDADTIQDLFEEAMAEDGYFEDLDQVTCDECGERYDAASMTALTLDDADPLILCPECYRDTTSA